MKRKERRVICPKCGKSGSLHLKRARGDEKIIDCLIALEALFLKGKKDPSNTGLYIGLGCSMLLGRNEKEREEINEFLVKAYNIRNRFVHGSEFITSINTNNELYEIGDFILQLQEYLRESIKRLM